MPSVRRHDAVVVGGGPAGLFGALALAEAGLDVVLLEAGGPMAESLCPKVRISLDGRVGPGSERYRMQCPRCTCLTGLGGAAFHFDTNLGYAGALQRSKIERGPDSKVRTFSTLARALGSFERAAEEIRDVFELLYAMGLPRDADEIATQAALDATRFDGVDLSRSQSITVDVALVVIERAAQRLRAAGGTLRLHTRATSLRRGNEGRRYVVDVERPEGGVESLHADAVLVAVGKLGLPWVRRAIETLDLECRPSRKVDVGVRLEGPRARMEPLCGACANPKLSYINAGGESVRTFCICAGGRIMQYEFEGAVVLDGQHCLTSPTGRSNLGIVTTMQVPPAQDGTELALGIARRVARVGEGQPVACTVGELRHDRLEVCEGEPVPLDTSLTGHTHALLSQCLPASVLCDVLGMVDRLNATFPGLIEDDAIVAAPVIERLYPELCLSESLESSAPGVYFVGDASSKIIGVTYGAATGRVAARAITSANPARSSAS